MNLILYNTSSDDLELYKKLNYISQYDIDPIFNNLGGLNFEMIVEKEFFPKNANFVFYDGKYYFKRDVKQLEGGLVSVSLEEDVLMSFQEQIGNTQGIVERSTKGGNPYLTDNNTVFSSQNTIDFGRFKGGSYSSFSNTFTKVITITGGN